jgi:hydroxyacylglutathione hydrolase
MPDPFTEIAPGVLVATGVLYTTTTTVVTGPDGSCLVIDPAVTVAEIAGLAAALAARGLRPVLGWATHAHWDHVLWHASLGDVPRHATPGGGGGEREEGGGLADSGEMRRRRQRRPRGTSATPWPLPPGSPRPAMTCR